MDISRFLYILMLVFATSCITQERCSSKFPPKEYSTVEITKIPKSIVLPSVSLTETLTNVLLETLKGEKPIIITDTVGRAELRLWKNKYGDLVVKCEALESRIDYEEKQKNKTKYVVNEKTVQVIPWYMYVIVALLTLFILLMLIIKIIR